MEIGREGTLSGIRGLTLKKWNGIVVTEAKITLFLASSDGVLEEFDPS